MGKILQYDLIKKISEKGISDIYTAYDEEKKLDVDVNLISKDSLNSSDVARIKQSFEAIKKVDNKGILTIYDVLDESNSLAIVQEKFEAGPISNYLKNNRFDLKTFLELSIVLSESLGYVHEENIIYRNIIFF